jgi:hypothetical protein
MKLIEQRMVAGSRSLSAAFPQRLAQAKQRADQEKPLFSRCRFSIGSSKFGGKVALDPGHVLQRLRRLRG